jgi:methanogenic corrinoid protein MtbC1
MNDLLMTIKEAVINKKRKEIEAWSIGHRSRHRTGPDYQRRTDCEAMDVVGAQFAADEIFVPEMLASALTMKMGLAKLKPSAENR